jgi:transposase
MNASKLAFPDEDPFDVISVDTRQDEVYIYVQSTSRSGICANCCTPSVKVHSYYTRKLDDLPMFGKISRIFLRSRKFYCRCEECPLKIFTERFESHFKPYKRRTERLEIKIRQLGLFAGGKPAERICGMVSMPVSDTTILRLVQKEDLPKAAAVSAVGVDDWAFKKRRSYGSILVNLHTGKVIDLLPDREEASLRKWLEQRPEIEIMTRDRYSNYQKAVTVGAPQAAQVADRWHLLKNLSESVQKILTRQYSKANAVLIDKQQQEEPRKSITIQPVSREKESADDLPPDGIRLTRFKQLKQLQGQGYSIRAMARHFGMHRQTVKSYLNMETLPRKSQGGANMLEKFFPLIKRRMEEEPHILLTTLWKDLRSEGYTGAYSTLSDALKYHGIQVGKKAGLIKKLPTRAGASFKPSTVAIWFVSDQDKLNEAQRKIINDLCAASNDLLQIFTLAQSFRNMMIERSGNKQLSGWIDQMTKSGINEMMSFAKGYRQTIQLLRMR